MSVALARPLGCLAVLAALALAGPHAEAQVPDSLLLHGALLNDATGRAYRFEVTHTGSVRFVDLGRAERAPNPFTGVPPPPDPALTTSFDIPLSSLQNVLAQIEDVSATPPVENRLGVGFDRRGLILVFEQGVPIWAAVLATLALLALGGAAVGWRLWLRERRRQRREAEARLRALRAREAERTRLAREIHDGPLQDVHALRLLSGDAAERVGDEATRIARELRAIAEGLRPPALGRFGLAAALSAHASRVKERHPEVTIDLDLDDDGPDTLPDLTRAALFRVAQEAVANAIEHGEARHVRIALRLPGGGADPGAPLATATDGPLRLEVADDGRGLPWEGRAPDLAALVDGGHFGLVGMHERASAVGGRLALDEGGLDGRGARVAFTLPMPRPAARWRPRPPVPA